jgi:uncharacterized protein (TIGR03067 family)
MNTFLLTLAAPMVLSVPNPSLSTPESSADGTWVLRPSGIVRLVIYKGYGHYRMTDITAVAETDITVKTDASRQPHYIDITVLDGPIKGKTLMGIYRRDGNTLMLIFSKTKRPTNFSAKDKPDSTYLLLTRE